MTTLSLYDLVKVIKKPTHKCSHIIDWVVVRPDDDIHKKSTVIDSVEPDHYCIKSYFNVSVSKPSTIYRTVRNMANIDHPSFIAELTSVSEFSSAEKANHDYLGVTISIEIKWLNNVKKIITSQAEPLVYLNNLIPCSQNVKSIAYKMLVRPDLNMLLKFGTRIQPNVLRKFFH